VEEQDIIEQYVNNTLSEQERNAFEQQLAQSEMLRAAVEEMALIREGIVRASRAQALHTLKELEATLPAIEAPVVPLWRNTWLQMAAGLSLLAVAVYLLWPRTQEPATLYAEYFEPYPNIIMPTVRGVLETDSTLKAQAYRAYDRQEYTQAISLFEQLREKDEAVLLYLGNSYLALSQPQKALPLFEKVVNEYEVFDEQAEWYLAVTYLKLEDREKATAALQKVVARESSYKTKAQQILKKLN
jgi:tetratricopeptide (TPR) repeat protein